MTFTVRALTTVELEGALLEPLLRVFAAALGYPPRGQRVLAQSSATRRHALRAGFRAFGALDEGGQLVGFSYGYASQPGLWWREQITPVLTPEQRSFWLADAFELCELHVHPSAQGRGLGGRLHDALVATLTQRTALLSVMHRSERARQLYARRGWQVLIEDMRFTSDPQTPFSVLGLSLTSSRRSPSLDAKQLRQ